MVSIITRNGMRYTDTGETVYSDEHGDYYYRFKWITLSDGQMVVDTETCRITSGELITRVFYDENIAELLESITWNEIFNGDIFGYVKCNGCGEYIIDEDKGLTYHGEFYCNTCVKDYFYQCVNCGELIHIDNNVETIDGNVCETCLDNYYRQCRDCGRYVKIADWIHDDDRGVCRECWRSGRWFVCDDCGRIEDSDYCGSNENGCYCEDCYDYHNNCADIFGIHEYGYRPDLEFKGEGILYFGTELEIDYGEKSKFDFRNLSNHFYCANDGSLSEEGFEIISHPMTYEWMMETTPFKQVCALAKSANFKSHNTDTCGFHVHMTRSAFGPIDSDATDSRITSFIFFFEKFWPNIAKFSRRVNFSYSERICSNDEEITHQIVDAKKKGIGFNHNNRYHCVNLTNTDTIEVRVFRGSLNENTLIASIQLCKLFYELSVFDIATIEMMTWKQIKEYAVTDYPELLTYMKEREL